MCSAVGAGRATRVFLKRTHPKITQRALPRHPLPSGIKKEHHVLFSVHFCEKVGFFFHLYGFNAKPACQPWSKEAANYA